MRAFHLAWSDEVSNLAQPGRETGKAILQQPVGEMESAILKHPVSEIRWGYDMVGPLRTRIALNQRQKRRLVGRRDALLPELLSGELELPEAVDAAEESL